jgi:hypothetical protein
MAPMKKILLGVVALVLVGVVAGGLYVAHLARSLNTPEFKEQLLAQARTQLGADVRIEDMNVALLSGVTLRGVAVANPAPFTGDLLTADAFVLRYRILPLLSGRVDLEKLALEKPAVRLAMDAKGRYNYEKIMAEGGSEKAEPAPAAGAAAPFDIVLKDLSVTDASLAMTDADEATLMSVQGADLQSAFRVSGGVTEGRGKATVATVDLGGVLFLHDVKAPLEMTKEALKLGPLDASVAGGRTGGDLTVHLQKFHYETSLELSGVSVRTLLEEAKAPSRVSGTLVGKAHFEGTAGLPTMKGGGSAEVKDCKVEDAKVLTLLSKVLQVPDLAHPEFSDCRVEFTLNGIRLSIPVVSLKGQALQLVGKGTMNLETSAIDYHMNLALSTALLGKIPVKELRAAFKEREDGLSAADFRVYGTAENPQTDLAKNVGKAAATEAAKSGVNKIFKKKIF